MLRKVTQLFLLPVLFALLAVGGKATLCDVLSVVGLDGHHHPHGSEVICLESHDHEHGHEEEPCPESCGFQLSEAPAPALLKVPAMSETYLLPFLLEVVLAAEAPATPFEAVDMLEPPDLAALLTDPTFTGRFLV